MTTINPENDKIMNAVDEVLKKAKNLLGEKMPTEKEVTTGQTSEDVAYRTYWNNVWKKADSLGTSFSEKVKNKFHREIDIDLQDAKKLLFDIITELEPGFDYTEHNKPILVDLIYYFTGNTKFSGDLSKGIFLYGKPGSGKTFILSCFMAFTMQLNFRRFVCYHCEEVAMKLKHNIETIDKYTNHPAMLDDLMREPKVNTYQDIIDSMKYIMSVRERKRVVTHATSNRIPGDIPKVYFDEDDPKGMRMESRAAAMFNFIYLHSEKDYRKR